MPAAQFTASYIPGYTDDNQVSDSKNSFISNLNAYLQLRVKYSVV